jgi:hypothetical protein
MTNSKSNVNQANNSSLSLQVTNDLTVQIFTNPEFDFLMDTNQVALGYGVAPATVRSHKSQNKDEFLENVHFISRVQNTNARQNLKTTSILWTKQGIIRLGFFIKSERAKLFRDWAESVILNVTAPAVQLPQVNRRKHNRLTTSRMVEILADIAQIDDKALRLSLISKLGI